MNVADPGRAPRRIAFPRPNARHADPALRNRTIRFKLYSLLSLPIAALILLWVFITGHIVGDFFEQRRAATLYDQVAAPAQMLAERLGLERRQSALFLSGTGPEGGRLGPARHATDQAVVLFHQRATSLEGQSATGPEVVERVVELERQLESLTVIREDVDGRVMSRLRAIQEYTRIQDTLYRLYDGLVTVPELSLYRQAVGLQTITRARELLSQEDALLSGAIEQGSLPAEEQRAFAQTVAGRRLLLGRGVQALDAELRPPYDRLLDSTEYRRFTTMENQVVSRGDLPVDATAWQPLAQTLGARMDTLAADRARMLNDRASAGASVIITQIVVAGGVGLLAILAAVVLSTRLGRGLARELTDLRSAALDLADVRLPRVVAKLRDSEPVDVDTEAPPIVIDGTTVEAQDVAQALSTVRRTAVEAAVGQADLRKGVSQVFRNLARRNQSLLHRQLTQLDTMQRKTNAPDALADLFRLDHLTTRMRRQAEGLIILSGAPAGRAWRKPVPMHDVVRGAVAEVEDYKRVTVLPMSDTALVGTAVADVIHMLAELVENATVFSPPSTRVTIRGQLVGRGFAVEIEDRGLGMNDEDRAEVNRRLIDPPEFNLADSDRLGLFVVSRLASRHDVMVTLRRSPYGGTTAVVLLPHSLIIPPPQDPPAPDRPPTPADQPATTDPH
ncbi:nitrate- and nitrite sensing domain-containing protein [Sphaerisporangium sp. TRM90804]|uniref:sensor histidine kinase n=1 Tax=Sphaerisporangium sp. TRM90804 TaxID=3031113 RepID=UPI002447C3CB|nr:nitrate- and nitrite sensing domain-containing protein [Sphaerisporangium sp. TRM90804]MDH2424392.1 nitrate- and nitrite sensing domain-containing protein [Sphaerisporangium sp. TRM90804]